jgi:hypothetical protein
MPIWGYFWKALEWKKLKYLCGHLVYFMSKKYIFWSFGIYSPCLVFCTKKISSGNPDVVPQTLVVCLVVVDAEAVLVTVPELADVLTGDD